jgi:predicted nucleic acid-binding protein
VLVSALTDEVHSAETDRWFAARHEERFFTSDWVITEFSSALSIKMRVGKLTTEGRIVVLDAFSSILSRSFEIWRLSQRHFRIATTFANRHELVLRGGDALHLALCQTHGVAICTLDRRMRDAAIALGIAAISPTPPV